MPDGLKANISHAMLRGYSTQWQNTRVEYLLLWESFFLDVIGYYCNKDLRDILPRSAHLNIIVLVCGHVGSGNKVEEAKFVHLELNEDMKEIEKDWVELMAAHYMKPHVAYLGWRL